MSFTQASEEKDLPLLLYTQNPDSFPQAENEIKLKDIMQQIGIRNLILEKELLGLIKALETIQVSVLLLKGAHLIQTLYPWGVRFVGDIDMLIKPEDFHKADKLIREQGYHPWLEKFPLWIHRHFSKKLTYIKDSTPNIPLDLHFSLGPYPYLGRIDIHSIWSQAQKIRLRDIQAFALCPEHLLIHLCLHLFQHNLGEETTSGYDAAMLIKHEGDKFPWNSFLTEVKKAEIQKPIYLALKIILDNFQVIIPDDILEQIAALPGSKKENLIFEHSKYIQSERKKHLLQFLTTPGLLARLGCLPYIFRWY